MIRSYHLFAREVVARATKGWGAFPSFSIILFAPTLPKALQAAALLHACTFALTHMQHDGRMVVVLLHEIYSHANL